MKNPGLQEILLLTDLRADEEAFVVQIGDPVLKLALLRIGLLEGDKVKVAEQAPWGGPVALRIKGTKVAMRRSDARKVQVRRVE